ncbi:MAG: hypothetical protein H4O13_15030 [Xanthomonadales bacterium]|nr:hypothetical protein [Xanthomonadales bacterium]
MDNPYAAPSTLPAAEAFREPEELARHVRHGVVAGCVSGGITLAITLAALFGSAIQGVDAWMLVDVALIFGLAYGIWRRSRAAATAMLIYFVASKLIQFVESGQPSGLLISALFVYLYTRAMLATFKLHALRREAQG